MTPSYTNLFPTGSHVLPPSLERWICWPNQLLDCDAYSRFGSAGDPLRWYISQPPKWGPLTSHCSRLASAVRTNAPLRVPTSTRTLLIRRSFTGARIAPCVTPRVDSFLLYGRTGRLAIDKPAEESAGRSVSIPGLPGRLPPKPNCAQHEEEMDRALCPLDHSDAARTPV